LSNNYTQYEKLIDGLLSFNPTVFYQNPEEDVISIEGVSCFVSNS